MGAGWRNVESGEVADCPCGEWRAHWERFARPAQRWPIYCGISGCTRAPVTGGVVEHPRVDGYRVVPMCSICRSRGDSFVLSNLVSLANANPEDTCDR